MYVYIMEKQTVCIFSFSKTQLINKNKKVKIKR